MILAQPSGLAIPTKIGVPALSELCEDAANSVGKVDRRWHGPDPSTLPSAPTLQAG
jgi:hypothetical protein